MQTALSRPTVSSKTALDCETLELLALNSSQVELDPADIQLIKKTHTKLESLIETNCRIYGITTGFGPLVAYNVDCPNEMGKNLLSHLCAGSGNMAPYPIIRATMILRLKTLVQAHSGISQEALFSYLSLLNSEIIPQVPELGSVGASGDLTPLAFIANILCGEGEAIYRNELLSAKDALLKANLTRISLKPRDALGLVNGTSFSTAYLSFAVSRAFRLLNYAEKLTGFLFQLLGCSLESLSEKIHQLRGHVGQIRSAKRIQSAVNANEYRPDHTRPFQDVYSIRCSPQVLGACQENLDFAKRLVETEMNGITDNPLIIPESFEPGALHGGNFFGQQIAFASDTLNQAITQMGILAERQIALLVNPQTNGNAPLLLAYEPGIFSGVAGAQITASALIASMRADCQAHSTGSIPTNGLNQDINPMATLATQKVYQQTHKLADILAILMISLCQLNHLRKNKKAQGKHYSIPPWFPSYVPFTTDRPCYKDIQRIKKIFLNPKL